MSRLGRGRPIEPRIVGLRPFEARVGSVSVTGGGTVAPGTFTRTNYVGNPSFEVDASGWSTSAFSVTPGALLGTGAGFVSRGAKEGTVDTSAQFNGVCYAPTDLGTFLSGATYYAQIDIQAVAAGDTLEIILGSTSDDFASKQFIVTNTYQTVQIAWTPTADRSASNHGLAIRTTMAGGLANNSWFIDAASISLQPEYIDGDQTGARWLGTPHASVSRLGGGKGSYSSTAITSGGTVATGFLNSSATGSTVAHGGGGITTTGVKNAKAVTVTHGGGGSSLTGASTQNTGFLPGGLLGGGGRVGRSHPAMGLAQAGVVTTVIAGTTARTGTVGISGGGSVTTATTKGARAATADTGAGGITTASVKGATSPVVIHGGGTVTLSAIATPAPGGVLGGMMLMGGGGRLGRSHPVAGVAAHGQPRLAPQGEVHIGAVAMSGGGRIATVGRKGGVSTTPVSIPAPPPELVDVLLLAGVLVHGGGSISVAYTRSASQVGSVAVSGGGSIRTTGSKSVAGSTTGSGGGASTLTVRRGARGITATSGGGSIATTYVLGQSVSHSIGMSGGGSVRTVGIKNATASTTVSSGGTLKTVATKKVAGTTSTTGGGSITLVGAQFGRQAVGAVAVHGGGTVNLTAGKSSGATVTISGGGRDTETHAKHAFGAVTVSGGGSIRTVRVNVPIPIYAGLVDADLEEELGVPVLLRR